MIVLFDFLRNRTSILTLSLAHNSREKENE